MIDRSPAEASNSQGLAEPSAMMTSALLVALNSPAMVAAATTGIPLTLTACTGAANQAFEYILVPPYTAPQAVATLGKSACLDIADYATAKSSPITAWPCGLDVMVNEYWTIKGDTLPIVQPYTPFCFGIDGASAKGAALADCTSSAAQFKIMEESTHNGTIVHKASGLCVTATGPAPRRHQPRRRAPPGPKNTPCGPLPAPAPPGPKPVGDTPCDIYAASGGTPCVAAHSMVRALYSNPKVQRASVLRDTPERLHKQDDRRSETWGIR